MHTDPNTRPAANPERAARIRLIQILPLPLWERGGGSPETSQCPDGMNRPRN
jgi:hypothetical protein